MDVPAPRLPGLHVPDEPGDVTAAKFDLELSLAEDFAPTGTRPACAA